VTAPDAPSGTVKGPASYFPSIEKTYGRPVSDWMRVLDDAGDLKHMELVNLLKHDHGIGHGHANALVAQFRSEQPATVLGDVARRRQASNSAA
jgi:hypothetical protein